MPATDRLAVTKVIRPAAVLREDVARSILVEVSVRDIASGGVWQATPTAWTRWNGPWNGVPPIPDSIRMVGRIEIAYGTPSRYEVTIYRVSITQYGVEQGWTISSLTNEALGYGGITLAECPRADMPPPPKPMRI